MNHWHVTGHNWNCLVSMLFLVNFLVSSDLRSRPVLLHWPSFQAHHNLIKTSSKQIEENFPLLWFIYWRDSAAQTRDGWFPAWWSETLLWCPQVLKTCSGAFWGFIFDQKFFLTALCFYILTHHWTKLTQFHVLSIEHIHVSHSVIISMC